MKSNVTKPNKKVFRVILAAAVVLLFCGAAVGAAAAEQGDLTAKFKDNSIVEQVTLHDVDTSQKYGLKLTASSLLWDEFKLQVLAESDLYIKPFKLEVTCNTQPYNEAKLTIGFKVDKQKVEEYKAKAKIEGDVEVRLGHLKEDRTWELLPVNPVTPASADGYLHYEVNANEPTSLFAIVVTKAPVTKEVDSNNTATLGDEGKMTIISSETPIASEVTLEKVSGLTEGDNLSFYNLSGNNPLLIATLENHPLPEGYISQKIISLFAVETKQADSSVSSSAAKNPVMHLNVAVKSGYDSAYVKVIHFKNGAWEEKYLPSKRNGNTYEVTTDGFSPFAVVYAEPKEKPTPASKSSTSQGTSVWLTAEPTPTLTPTPTPTVTETPEAPAVKPVANETQAGKSPVPLAGVIAGLGCAAVLFGLRMRR